MDEKDIAEKITEKQRSFRDKVKDGLTKDFLKKTVSILLVCAVLVLNGFLSFMGYGGVDFSRLATSEYWLNYGLLVGSEIIILIALYIYRKQKDLQDKEIIDISNFINNSREKIYKINKVRESCEYLRNYYNPRERLQLYEDKIRKMQESCNLNEPYKVDKPTKQSSKLDKKKYKEYIKALKQYESDLKKFEWCNKQIELIKKSYEKLELAKVICVELAKVDKNTIDKEFIKKNQEEIEKLDKEIIKEKFAIGQFKIKYENVYWDVLVANTYNINSKHRPSVYFNEKKKIADRARTFLITSLFISAVLMSMLPPIWNEVSWETILTLLFRFILLCWAGFQGVLLADNNILFDYKTSLTARKTIYNELNYNLQFNKIVVEDKRKEQN